MSLSEGYASAIEETGATLAKFTKPIWAIIRRTPWADDFLGTMFKWGALYSDVPCAIVPKSTSPHNVLRTIRKIIRQKRQRFPMLKKYLSHICRNYCPDGLTGFQANVATNLALSKLIGGGFVAFADEARLYPQYASKYVEKLTEHWPHWLDLDSFSAQEGRLTIALYAAKYGEQNKDHLTTAHNVRAYRADKRLNEAYAYEEMEIRPVRKWLAQKYPRLNWAQWHGSGIFYDARNTLKKVNAYIDRKDSARESHAAWEQHNRVNEERLSLWREWWASTIQPLAA